MRKKVNYQETSEGVAGPTPSEVDTVVYFLSQTREGGSQIPSVVAKKLDHSTAMAVRFLASQQKFSIPRNPSNQ